MKRSLFGYGGTTRAIARSGGWDIYDDTFNNISTDEWGNTLLPVKDFNPQNSKLEITSPGIPPSNLLIKQACNLISEYDFFEKTSPFKIWISGTNGKTTTAKMTQHLLEKYGSVLGGNVGTALALLPQDAKIWILETSSFTIHYTKTANPGLYLLLPITPDHLSWHGSMQEYENAKLKPLSLMQEGSIAVLPAKFKDKINNTMAYTIFYESEEDIAKICGINIDEIKFKTPFLLDALLALMAEKILFDNCNIKLLNKFIIEEHKLEELTDKQGRTWVNDTKATNIDATIQAIKRYEKSPIRIILGGDDKGVDMSELFEEIVKLKDKIHIYAIGKNGQRLIEFAKNYGIKATLCGILDNAVKEINTSLKADEIALLSPAAASLDQFSSYAHRGNKFKELIKSL